MAHVVFLRAANVGGKNVFKPAQLARTLAHLDMVNIGAAGTFVVRATVSARAITKEILANVPFKPAIAVRPGSEILALVRSEPFRGVRFARDKRGWAAVLCGRPKSRPSLPLVKPAGREWSVRFERVEGAFALGLWHWRPGGFLFASNVVEDVLGVPATTRWWETIERVAKVLED